MSDKPNIPAPNSLVKYASATLVSTSGKPIKDKKKGRDAAPQSITNAQTEDILNSILPPRVSILCTKLGIHNGEIIIMDSMCFFHSSEKRRCYSALRKFRQKLQQRQARETGICPIREELYAQCFDELIRQITINCAERGLLLVRVRDEIRQTIQAYQTLYESSIAFGMRKALQAEQRKTDYNNKIKQLETECQDLSKQVEKIESTIEDMQRQDQEQQEHEEAKHRDQVNFLKMQTKCTKKNQRNSLQVLMLKMINIILHLKKQKFCFRYITQMKALTKQLQAISAVKIQQQSSLLIETEKIMNQNKSDHLKLIKEILNKETIMLHSLLFLSGMIFIKANGTIVIND